MIQTQAMLISTQHLLPQVLPPIQVEPQLLPTPSAELAFDADPIATMAVSAGELMHLLSISGDRHSDKY